MNIIKKEIITDGINGLCFIFFGVLNCYGQHNLFTSILKCLVLIASFWCLYIKNKKKSEPWDEMARINYANASKKELNIGIFLLLILAFIMTVFPLKFKFNVGHVMILFGILQSFRVILFILEEKRGQY